MKGKMTKTSHQALSDRTKAEVTRLLKRHEDGKVTGMQMHTRLKSVQTNLSKLNLHYRDLS
jgi:hypothetical protein